MNRLEHLLTIGAEECAEVAQRLSKALRFGLNEVQPDPHDNPQRLTNVDRIRLEFQDLVAVLAMADIIDIDCEGCVQMDAVQQGDKVRKVEHFLQYSTQVGTQQPWDLSEACPVCSCPEESMYVRRGSKNCPH